MTIGLLTIELFIGDAESLKEKRFVLKSLKDKLRNKFNISVAEEANNLWQRVSLHIVSVSMETKHVNSVLEKVKNSIEKEHRVELIDYSIEMI